MNKLNINNMKDIIWIFVKKYRKYMLFLCDILIWNFSFYISCVINKNNLFVFNSKEDFWQYLLCINICFSFVFVIFKLYDKIWRYADAEDFFYAGVTSFCANLLFFIISILINLRLRLKLYIIFCLVSTFGIFLFRILYRINILLNNVSEENYKNKKRMLIVGAGDCAVSLIKIISKYSENKYFPVAFVDDDSEKIGRKIRGVRVEGSTNKIPEICEKFNIEIILFAINSISGEDKRRILDICAQTSLEVRIIPNIYEVITSGISLESAMRKIKVEDLLGREPVIFDKNQYGKYLINKNILVTGAGGSIGSELCRQIAQIDIKKLIILDIYENSAYEIEQELRRKFKINFELKIEICTICDKNQLEKIFKSENIDIIFHAAAHKHVPLMEKNVEEAVKNNVFGTLNLLELSDKYNIQKFVQISTDKAVNPTNIMGATKRLCEMLVQVMNKKSKTEFVAVRFGNVLGSNGSVIPLFEEQIKAMGPVTVTHPDIIRYFMTIPEAVSLVLTAGGFANGGEIFVLDMGEPVKITTLAENLIKLSGLTPHVDIKIEYIGLRPGEKLYEELLMDEENMRQTKNKKIYIGSPININEQEFYENLNKLKIITNIGTNLEIEQSLKKLVPTFKRAKN